MNATDTKIIADADRMSESTLVSLGDWQLAYLRVAMLNSVEDAVNDSLEDKDFISRNLTTNRIPGGSEVRGIRGIRGIRGGRDLTETE